ncbi:MAG: SpoIID/LytB domain-containing protein, partial [Ignavibacteriales bacterium]
MNKRIAIWTVIFLLIATAATVLHNKTALAVNKPVNVIVGLSTSESVCDFKVISGEYQLFAGSADTPLTVPQPQTLWRAAFMADSKTMELYSMSADGSWADLGSFPSISLVPLTGQGETVFSYNGKTYRGSMKVTLNRTSSALTVINELPLEHYLYGVVPREMSNQWPIEALKAQAV